MCIHPNRAARRGITLLEVLTAIFIMGIGLLAILTLFPLGALSMAQAVRDERAAAAGANAAGLAVVFDLRNDGSLRTVDAAVSNPLNVSLDQRPPSPPNNNPKAPAVPRFRNPDPDGPNYP